jgi:hypothetical protein
VERWSWQVSNFSKLVDVGNLVAVDPPVMLAHLDWISSMRP